MACALFCITTFSSVINLFWLYSFSPSSYSFFSSFCSCLPSLYTFSSPPSLPFPCIFLPFTPKIPLLPPSVQPISCLLSLPASYLHSSASPCLHPCSLPVPAYTPVSAPCLHPSACSLPTPLCLLSAYIPLPDPAYIPLLHVLCLHPSAQVPAYTPLTAPFLHPSACFLHSYTPLPVPAYTHLPAPCLHPSACSLLTSLCCMFPAFTPLPRSLPTSLCLLPAYTPLPASQATLHSIEEKPSLQESHSWSWQHDFQKLDGGEAAD